MIRPSVIVTNWVQEPVIKLLEAHFDVVANPDREPWSPEAFVENLGRADAAITFMTDKIDEVLLRKAPRLKIVSCCLKGFDNFDIEACTRHGVLATVLPDLLTDPGAELAIGLMIAAGRHITAADAYVRRGEYKGWRPRFYGKGLAKSAIGIVGFGAIGQSIAERLVPFRSEVHYWDRRMLDRGIEERLCCGSKPFQQLLSESDYVVLALALSSETRHIISSDALSVMKPDAILVNVARGSLVDEAAVAEALKAGRLAFYASDVFELEDWVLEDRPRSIAPELISQMDRTLFTPHLGSAVTRVREEMAMQAARNVIDFFEGRLPEGCLNSEVMSSN